VIDDPKVSCDYEINPAIYNCPDYLAGTHNNIAIVNVSDGCVWDAEVTQGGNWIVCNSDGNGSGTIDITVIENSADTSRSGIIIVETETLLIVQPPDPWLTGVSSITNNALKIYPNPSEQNLTVEVMEGFANANFTVFDVTGRQVLTGKLTGIKQDLSVENLTMGMYTIRLDNGQESVTQPFFKN
jgi:hypothetical protein